MFSHNSSCSTITPSLSIFFPFCFLLIFKLFSFSLSRFCYPILNPNNLAFFRFKHDCQLQRPMRELFGFFCQIERENFSWERLLVTDLGNVNCCGSKKVAKFLNQSLIRGRHFICKLILFKFQKPIDIWLFNLKLFISQTNGLAER